jgi:uncharacterized protein (TIGR02118 family)
MPVGYFVRYRGLPQPQDAFVEYYRTRHAALLRAFPGIRSLVIHTPANCHDPQAVSADGSDFLAEMQFSSLDALGEALRSPARERARIDFANLPRGTAAVTHQAMFSERLF